MTLDEYLKLPYAIELRRDEDGDWVARVLELQGCTAHGATQPQALEQLEEVKRDWIQAALEDNIPIPEPEREEDDLPSGKWVQRVPRSLHQRLRHLAKREGTSLNNLVALALAEWLGTRAQGRIQAQGQVPSVGLLEWLGTQAQGT